MGSAKAKLQSALENTELSDATPLRTSKRPTSDNPRHSGSAARIERALMVVAKLVVDDTDYLPVFLRLEEELTMATRQQDAVARAASMAQRQRRR